MLLDLVLWDYLKHLLFAVFAARANSHRYARPVMGVLFLGVENAGLNSNTAHTVKTEEASCQPGLIYVRLSHLSERRG